MPNPDTPFIVCALYQFTALTPLDELKTALDQLMNKHRIYGTLLLASEGINGTVASDRDGIDALMQWLADDGRFDRLESKESVSHVQPFKRQKVKLKNEIVTMGVEAVDPKTLNGTYVEPKDWNALISDPAVLVIDTRNRYETELGYFEGAVDPHTDTFREFPHYAEAQLQKHKHKKIAMYCTGGIRCEKSTALLKQQGFDEVYHLKGGILQYLEDVPEEESLWRGECFVFDDRVSVNHQLEPGAFDQCHACRFPITQGDKRDPRFEQGVSCPRCFGHTSEAQLQRFRERQKQMALAAARGEQHLAYGAEQRG